MLGFERLSRFDLKHREIVSCLNDALATLTNADEVSNLEDGNKASAALLLRTVVRQSYLLWAFAISDVIHNLRVKPRLKEVQQKSSPLYLRSQARGYVEREAKELGETYLKNSSFDALAILLATEFLRQRHLTNCAPQLCRTSECTPNSHIIMFVSNH